MSFEKGTGPWQITKKVLDDYEKKNPITTSFHNKMRLEKIR